MSFEVIADFEKEIANFFGAPYAVAVDCCTHGLELCLRYKGATKITVPKHTYLSVPMLAEKLDLEIEWTDDKWQDYYYMTDSRHYDFVAFGAISPLAKYSFLKGSINYEDSLNVNNYFNISSLRKEKISENQFLKVIP